MATIMTPNMSSVATQTGLDDIDPAIGARQPAIDGDGARDAPTR